MAAHIQGENDLLCFDEDYVSALINLFSPGTVERPCRQVAPIE